MFLKKSSNTEFYFSHYYIHNFLSLKTPKPINTPCANIPAPTRYFSHQRILRSTSTVLTSSTLLLRLVVVSDTDTYEVSCRRSKSTVMRPSESSLNFRRAFLLHSCSYQSRRTRPFSSHRMRAFILAESAGDTTGTTRLRITVSDFRVTMHVVSVCGVRHPKNRVAERRDAVTITDIRFMTSRPPGFAGIVIFRIHTHVIGVQVVHLDMKRPPVVKVLRE